jgi:hypothetical protein
VNRYKEMLEEVLEDKLIMEREGKHVPVSKKLELAREYLYYLSDKGKFIDLMEFAEVNPNLNTIAEVLSPVSLESGVQAKEDLVAVFRKRALHIIDHILKSEFDLRYKMIVGED